MMQQMQMAQSQAPPAVSPAAAEEVKAAQRLKYTGQLEELKSMGFEDEDACLRALDKHAGDVELAVGMLADDPNVNEPTFPEPVKPLAMEAEKSSDMSYEDDEVVAHVYDIS